MPFFALNTITASIFISDAHCSMGVRMMCPAPALHRNSDVTKEVKVSHSIGAPSILQIKQGKMMKNGREPSSQHAARGLVTRFPFHIILTRLG